MSFGDEIVPEDSQAKILEFRQRAWTWIDLVSANIAPPASFLGDLVIQGEITLIAGFRGAMKTHLALEMAYSIGTGCRFGNYPTVQSRCHFLSQEMGLHGMSARMARFDKQDLFKAAPYLTMDFQFPMKADSDTGLDDICKYLSLNKDIRVVFLDALSDIRGDANENSNAEMGDLMRRLRDRLARKFDVGVVILHHKGKPGQNGDDKGSRGASAIEDVPAVVLYAKKAERHEPGTLSIQKLRDGNPGPDMSYDLALEESTGRLHLSITNPEVGLSDTLESVLEAIPLAGATKEDLLEATKLSEDSFRRAVTEGNKKNKLRSDRSGVGKTTRYFRT